jgi:hypothetical protein
VFHALLCAYIEALLWSSSDDTGASLECCELSEGAAQACLEACASFWLRAEPLLRRCSAEQGWRLAECGVQAGHDFWLTRAGHGAGFWDGDWPQPYSAQLTAIAQSFRALDPYLGDDGLVCLM